MKKIKHPFGQFKPNLQVQKKIDLCQRLPANWLGKQLAQFIRKRVLKTEQMPMDLSINNVHLRSNLTDNVSERNFIFMPWRFDVIERQILLEVLPKDGVFIDIGANVGIYSTIAISHLQKLGRVVAIEPNPVVFSRLQFNLNATAEMNKNIPEVDALMLGVSNKNEEIELFLDDNNLGASSLIPNKSQNSLIINCQTLLKIVETLKITKIDVIKCDIEGAEDKALAPFLNYAPKTLLPQCIVFENNNTQWQSDLLTILKQKGYKETHKTRMNYIYQHIDN